MRMIAALAVALTVLGCEDPDPQTVLHAREHAAEIAKFAESNLTILRQELPIAAKRLGRSWGNNSGLTQDLITASKALAFARGSSRALSRVSSSFFAISYRGIIVRSDQAVDEIAGTSLQENFPTLRGTQPYREAIGVLPQANMAGGKQDGHWIASSEIVTTTGNTVGQYVVGLSWSDWARRLESELREGVRERRVNDESNLPLLYCFILVGDAVYGGPQTPALDARALAALKPLQHLSDAGEFSQIVKIEGRTFAAAVRSFSVLAPGVALGVLRSET